jgi:hypothetical protein
VRLSVLIATNRRGLLVCSRIAQACSWSGPELEVLVRDNSGDPEKRALLTRFRRENCAIILAEPCDALTNFNELLSRAKGDFVFLLADDDFCFDHAIAALPSLLDQIAQDPRIVGVTGLYAVETSRASAIVSYPDVELDDMVGRISGFLRYQGPNVLHYAPVRRDVLQRVFGFVNALPLYFSFHDQITCLLFLLNGKFARLNRLLYLYDMGPWESADSAQAKDLTFYREAGLDPAVNKLHWFLCGFEGAALIRNGAVFPDYPAGARQAAADQWFSTMFLRFRGQVRHAFDSRHSAEADRLCARLQAACGRLAFQDMLAEISGFIALFSPQHAREYFEFWDALINGRGRVVPAAAAAAG